MNNSFEILKEAKSIDTGVSTTDLVGSAIGIGIIFGCYILATTRNERRMIN